MANYSKLTPPTEGEKITIQNKKLHIPDNPIIPFITGDGIGPDIMKATRRVVDASVEKVFKSKKKIVWFEIFAGELAQQKYGELLPEDTLTAIKEYYIALKGPLTTPVGGGFRSLNVTLRQVLDLFACVRPVKYIKGVPSPVKRPEDMDVVIFRENTEDVYAGIEWQQGSAEAKKVIDFIKKEFNITIREDSGIGIKPISIFATKRLMRAALDYAIKLNRKSITIVHKGNIMKYTEGAFRDWCYETALQEYRDKVLTEKELSDKYNGKAPAGKIVIKDRIADSMLQQILTRTADYDVIVLPNLNGDYLSDAAAAQVGGLGLAPGANIGEYIGLFEATHGTAPKYANKDVINPGSLILSACLMLEYMEWTECSNLIKAAIEKTILQKTVTYDLARLLDNATEIGTTAFADAIIKNL
ncbi:MAG TPA: isocitrate dehydrogenase (NADP(+)) [bacterium]|nr:isocitrate dehydrogenase (NADP(+)) [bacterium]